MSEPRYLLDNAQPEAGERFDAFAQLFDPWTFAHLSAVGLQPGWRVWEVGAGGRSVPSWLAAQVGADGRVLATDLDVSWLGKAAPPLEVRRHDVGADAPPEGPFDLVHARLVLVHVPQRDAALAAMAGVLRPGGWLVVEDADPALQPLVCPDEMGAPERLANRLKTGFRDLLAARGADLAFGRTLPRRLRDLGLTDVCADAYFPVTGPAAVELERATTEQLREQLVSAGIAGADEVDQHLDDLASRPMDFMTSPLITAWGRKP